MIVKRPREALDRGFSREMVGERGLADKSPVDLSSVDPTARFSISSFH